MTNEWLSSLEEHREELRSEIDLNAYFSSPEIGDKKLEVIEIGLCSIPSGEIVVADPLVYLASRDCEPYFQSVSTGEYMTELCVVKDDEDEYGDRYAAVRLRFTKEEAQYFEVALVGDENLEDENFCIGFAVDAGMAAICDKKVHALFCDFNETWDRENPDGEIYDDYFAPLFAESASNNPKYQRTEGDWINWTIPNTEYHIPMFQSGFGDGFYPVYWGYDSNGNICQLVIHFIDVEWDGEEGDDDE